jgi:peptide/nickel transport system permease protein
MALWRYALRRLLLLIPVLFGITVVAFALTHIVPRNPVYALVGAFADQRLVDETVKRYGLDQPLPAQYVRYLGNLLRGDLGNSIRTGRPVLDEIVLRLPATLELTTLALLVAVAVALVLGTAAALQRNRPADYLARLLALVGNSLPEFWLGLLFVFVFYFQLGWAPPPIGRIPSAASPPPAVTNLYVVDALLAGSWPTLVAALSQLALPVLTLAFVVMAPIMRTVRAGVIEVMQAPFVRCAEAHGLYRRRILVSYVLRNALLSVVTLIAIIYGYLLGGAVLIEKVFSWPGLGLWAADAILNQDYPVVQAFVLLAASFYVLVYLAADLLLAVIDPRIRY